MSNHYQYRNELNKVINKAKRKIAILASISDGSKTANEIGEEIPLHIEDIVELLAKMEREGITESEKIGTDIFHNIT